MNHQRSRPLATSVEEEVIREKASAWEYPVQAWQCQEKGLGKQWTEEKNPNF